MWWLIILYLVVASLVILCAASLSSILDQLDKRTRISSVFLGGVVLAIVTSLPDLFTAVSSICFIQKPELAFGGILGGDFINLAILGVFMCVCAKLFSQSQINKRFLITTIACLIISILILLNAFLDISLVITAINVNGLSIAIVAMYTLMLVLNRGQEKEVTVNAIPVSRYSVKQLVLFFCLTAVALIVLSVGLSYITNVLSDHYMIETTFAGALFIGIATALPEIVTTIVFIKKKNFNLAVGNIVGSVAFNWIILVICDIFYFNGSIFAQNESSQLISIFLTTMLSILSVVLAIKCFKKKDNLRWFYACAGIALASLAIAYIALSFFIV